MYILGLGQAVTELGMKKFSAMSLMMFVVDIVHVCEVENARSLDARAEEPFLRIPIPCLFS